MTGPAIMNIFAPTPGIKPSLLNSIAGDATAFEKPVIGTRVPAPPIFAILSYQPKAVKRAPRKIRVTLVRQRESFRSAPSAEKASVKA